MNEKAVPPSERTVMKYAISSHQATIYGMTCLGYVALRSAFESLVGKMPFVGRAARSFNRLLLGLARTAVNTRLIGPGLFDAVEFHLTDPRIFYDPAEWRVNENVIRILQGPISSFHAHVERSPFLRKYVFNLAETSRVVRHSIASQLQVAYRAVHSRSKLVVAENPVIVFHPGMARNDDDRENALLRLRQNLDYMAETNERLSREYGRDRRVVPTLENSPADRLSLCQTIDEWKRAVKGYAAEVKLTLDYGHLLTVDGERERLFGELAGGTIGHEIVNLHLHYSPQVDNTVHHAHSPLSIVPLSRLAGVEEDVRRMVDWTAVRRQGYITLEIPSGDPLDYMPWLRHLKRSYASVARWLKGTGLFDWNAYRGTLEDQLASLRMVKEALERAVIEVGHSTPLPLPSRQSD